MAIARLLCPAASLWLGLNRLLAALFAKLFVGRMAILPFVLAAMVPIGKPVKQLTKLSRKPVEEFTTWDRFDGEVFSAEG